MLRNCLYSTIAPQALSANERNTYGSFRGTAGVQNTNVDAKVNRLWNYPITNGLTLPNTMCKNGALNVDNTCSCPGTRNSMPWQVSPLQPIVNKMLFEPFVEGAIPPLSPAAKKLILQRSPLPNYLAGNYPLDWALPCYHTDTQKLALEAEMEQRSGAAMLAPGPRR